MAQMQRATIEEAAASLGVSQSAIELQIKAGGLVLCQDPSFRRCVWIRDSPKAKPKRKPRAALSQDVDSVGLAGPIAEIGVPLEAVALLETEPEITVPKPKRKARAAPKKDIQTRDLVWSGPAQPDEENGLPEDTIAEPEVDLEICAPKLNAPKLNRKTKNVSEDTPEEEARSNGVDLVGHAGVAKEIGLLQKTVDLLKTELEISAPKLRRKAKDTPQKNTRINGVDPIKPPKETGLLRDTITMLKAELEIRDDQLDLLGVQLELSRQEVRKLRLLLTGQLETRSKEVQNLHHLLNSIQLSEPAHKNQLYENPLPLPVVAFAGQPADGEVLGPVAELPDPVPPALRPRRGYFRIFGRSFRPFVGLLGLGFSLPLFH